MRFRITSMTTLQFMGGIGLVGVVACTGTGDANDAGPDVVQASDAGDASKPVDASSDVANDTDASVTYPSTPPAKICGSAELTGPSTAPQGAFVVDTNTDLVSAVTSHPAGTTFYLTAGTHHLALGQNVQVVPKDGDVFIGAPGAILDGQHSNLLAFTQHAKNVTLRYFTIQNFGTPGSTHNEGTVNHDAGDGWLIEYMTIQNNSGAGIFIGSNNTIRHDCIRDNGQYGFSSYAPSGISNVVLDHDEISGNNADDWETLQPGCGCTGGGKFWATVGGTVTNNWVHDNKSVGLWADTNNAGFDFEGNYIEGNSGPGIMYEISYNARIAYNTLKRNAIVNGPKNPGFPTGAVYISESGGDSRAGGSFTTIEIAHNDFEDNWSGVVLWENANRFCNSPVNTSTGTCTLVGPTLSQCADPGIASKPLYDDCRWKTENVAVHDNIFSIAPANVGSSCAQIKSCGVQAVISNTGTTPSWSPYMGAVVEQAITFDQDNVFSKNAYHGPWTFMAHDTGNVLTTSKWQAGPYGQDVGSTFQ